MTETPDIPARSAGKKLPSLTTSLVKALLTGLIIIFAVATTATALYGNHILRSSTLSRINYIHTTQANNIAQLLWDIELEKIDVVLKSTIKDENIEAARVLELIDGSYEVFSDINWPETVNNEENIKSQKILYTYNDGRAREIGALEVIVDYSSIEEQIRQLIIVSIIVFAGAAFLLGALIYYLLKRGIDPITKLSSSLVYADYSTFEIKKEKCESREINDLFDSLIKMQNILKLQTREIESQKVMLDTIIEKMPLGVMVESFDNEDNQHQGDIMVVNDMFRRLFDLKRDETWGAGTSLENILPPEHVAFLTDLNKTTLETKQQTEKEFESNVDNQRKIIHTIKAPIVSGGNPPLIVTMFNDITERVIILETVEEARERAEEASRAKSDFLANMSHEIRTPLNAILGMSNLLLDTRLESEQKDWATAIKSSGDTLLGIINDIIDISKIEAGKLELEKTNFHLTETLEEVMNLYAYQAREKQLEMMMSVDPDIPDHVLGDPVRLKQIVANLVSNALKFTEEGHVFLRVNKNHASKSDKLNLIFEIEDSGIGVPESKQKHIFEKFSQAEESTTRKFGGTGLGLTIVSELIDLMHGEIDIESEEGKGSTFIFNVVLEEDKEKKEDDLKEDYSNLHVLIVDDYELTRKLLSTALNHNKIKTTTAESAEDALEIIEKGEKKFDTCLIDYSLGGMNGLKLVEKIREHNEHEKMALIMISGAMERRPYEELKEMGLDGFFNKPFQTKQILSAISIASRSRKEKIKNAHFVTRHNVGKIVKDDFTSPEKTAKEGLYVQYEGKKVLAVDDMKMNMMLIKKVLSKFGLDISTASNGLEAYKAVQEQEFDAIFMDCQMPEMDGFEASAKIREFEEKESRKNVPIVALTADAMIGDREKCLSFGMNDYINKPFKEIQIAEALATWINNSDDTENTEE